MLTPGRIVETDDQESCISMSFRDLRRCKHEVTLPLERQKLADRCNQRHIRRDVMKLTKFAAFWLTAFNAVGSDLDAVVRS